MKKKKSIYIGGEEDEQSRIIPKHFERFFNKKTLFIILAIICLLLLALG